MTIKVHAYIGGTDLERGIEFYSQALGLGLRRRLDDDWTAMIPRMAVHDPRLKHHCGTSPLAVRFGASTNRETKS